MTQKLKLLCFSFAVIVAMSTMAVSSAHATQIHAATGPNALLVGEQTTQHTVQLKPGSGGPSIKCTQIIFETTLQGGSQSTTTDQALSQTGIFTGCTFLGLAATITVNGCKFTLTNTVPTVSKTVNVDIAGCTVASPRMEVHVPGCTLTIPQQTGLPHVTLAQNGSDVEANLTVSGIKYEWHGAACALGPETVVASDGTLHGGVTLRGYVDTTTQLASHNGHQYSKGVPGAQVALVVT